jgi:hypothetical protein
MTLTDTINGTYFLPYLHLNEISHWSLIHKNNTAVLYIMSTLNKMLYKYLLIVNFIKTHFRRT